MIAKTVRDILVPIADFPVIAPSATLREAYALLQGRHAAGGWRYRHMLVLDEGGMVAGVLSLQDMLRALMPEYIKASLRQDQAGGGDDRALVALWQEGFAAQCRLAADLPVSACMTEVRHTVDAADPLTRAAYLMILRGVHMLPVLDGARVVGVVRIVDVFNQAAAEVLHV